MGRGAKKNERNSMVLELALKGVKHCEIAKQFNITKQRITQILSDQGYTRQMVQEERFKPIVEQYQQKLKEASCFLDVRDEIKENGHRIERLKQHGLKYNYFTLAEKRNRKIASVYKSGKTAKEILEHGVCGISSLTGVYNSIGRQNAQKIPQVRRGEKGIYEDKEVMRQLLILREKEKLSFQAIADKLNEMGFKTIGGKDFAMGNTIVKYHKFYKHSKKDMPEKFKAKKSS